MTILFEIENFPRQIKKVTASWNDNLLHNGRDRARSSISNKIVIPTGA
jgi:hypothetical protein